MKKIKQRGLSPVPSVFSLSISNADQETSSRSTLQNTFSENASKIRHLQENEIAQANKNFIKQTYKIARTPAGRAFFLEVASQISTNSDVVQHRQAFIKALQAEPVILKKIRQILREICEQEKRIALVIDTKTAPDIAAKEQQEGMFELLPMICELKDVLTTSQVVRRAHALASVLTNKIDLASSNEIFIREALKKPAEVARFYGELDVYASIAARMLIAKSNKGEKKDSHSYCFAELAQPGGESFISAENLWGPVPSTTIPQAIHLGTSLLHSRTIVRVLRTNNRSQENFLLSTIPYNVLLAQTLGVACASSFKFTPFTHMLLRVPLKESTDPASFKNSLKNHVALVGYFEELCAEENAFVVTDMGSFFEPSIQEMLVNAAAKLGQKPNIVCMHVVRKVCAPFDF